MPRLKENQLPSYRLHKQSGQAIVTLSGRDVLLGKYNSAASKAEYKRVTSEWLAGNRTASSESREDLSVSELVLAFWRYAKSAYRCADGLPTGEAGNFRRPLKLLRQLYGRTAAKDFGPLALKAVRHEMIRLGWCRSSINRQVSRVRQVFKWGVENELVPAIVLQGLKAVSGLRCGRTDAAESEPVKAVSMELVDAVLPFLSAQVKAIVELQLLTGMRPGEVCSMRMCDLDMSGSVWKYKPASHKTAHHGHERVIYIGPKARAIIEKFTRPDVQGFLFSPTEAETTRREKMHEQRTTPPQQGNATGTNRTRRPRRRPGMYYTVNAYRRAIARACEQAFEMPADIREPRTPLQKSKSDMSDEAKKLRRQKRDEWRAQHVWHPHQLRHTAATSLRKEYGLEAAQVILGHKTLTVTQIYAEKNVEAAQRIMAEVG